MQKPTNESRLTSKMGGHNLSVDSYGAQKSPILWTQTITNEISLNLIIWKEWNSNGWICGFLD